MSRERKATQAQELRRAIRSNKLVLRLSRHWLVIVMTFLLLYTGLALAAPVLMQAGASGPANVLYTIYAPMCHQFAFRSWFFFGEQSFYPRAVSGVEPTESFEYYASRDDHFEGLNLMEWTADLQLKSRSFKGNDAMGYKAALCERDIAIYGTMFLVGLLFARVRHWLRPAPLWLYLILGLMPLGLDGFSQLLSYPPFEFWPVRETLPPFRIMTGALFGLMNVWLAFPYLESSMRETVEVVGDKVAQAERKLARIEARGG